MSTVTPKQYRVAAQHLKQAQESLRLARHFLGGSAEPDSMVISVIEIASAYVGDAITPCDARGVE